ncbi:DUF1566 domain-containing protein [Desulfococcaceae bacterium HSG8]|nr:DUF1566 domain-containing protein [Desulfococcaceae bacterium HSG8]
MTGTAKTVTILTIMILCLCGIPLRQAQDKAFAGALPDTGQTKCYNNTSEIACPSPGEDFYGQDAQYITNPRSYTKLQGGIMVQDNVTGLIWEVKTDDGSVHDKDNTYTWDDAQNVFIAELNSANFGGYSDWRLPTVKELGSLVNLGQSNPAIDTGYFPHTLATNYYWTSTAYAFDISSAWGTFFLKGSDSGHVDKLSVSCVRAVRGSSSGSSNRFTDNGNGTVTDTETGLIWQKQCPDSAMNWKDALAYCENLSLAGYNDWRLPNKEELRSIADYETYTPTIDTGYFPNTISAYYWSSATYDNISAWCIHFSNGIGSMLRKTLDTYTRAVRGGVTPPPSHALTTNNSPASGGSISRSPDKSAYDHNESVTLTATPDACYNFTNWSGDCSGTSPTCTLTMDSDKSVTANFAIKTYSLTVTASKGSVTKSPSASSYDCGTAVSLTANPNTGWHFVRWEGDVSGTSTSASLTMTANRSVTAIFEEDIPDTYTLIKTASPASGGAISASPDKSAYTSGESVTLTASPEACYDFTGWSGACSGTSSTCTLTMNANKSVTANFAVRKYSVNVTANNGSVTKSPDQSSYDCGTTVLLTAEPDDCYDFTGWSGACSGTSSTCSLTVDADKSVTANFSAKKYSLNITANNGSVSKSPDQSSYDCGTTVLLTATPDSGYNFDRWEGDTSGTQTTASLTMTKDMNITAIFSAGTYTVSGYVRDGNNNSGISGVTLDFSNSGGSATTDSSGFYTRPVSKGWSGTVTPDKSGYSFTPQNRSYSDVTADQSDQDYTAVPEQENYTLSGYVRDPNNIGISGVTLSFGNGEGSASTNNSGYYTHTVSSGWSGTVTPSKQGYTFDPSERSYTPVSSDQFNQDYIGNPIPYIISGYVRDSGNKGLSGVILNFSNYAGSAETDSSGYYSHTVYYGWTGTVTPGEVVQYTITATSGANGVITPPAGVTTVNRGTNLTLTMNPDFGYEVDDVVVDGVSVGAITSYAFTKIMSDHTISVTFVPTAVIQYRITADAGNNGSISPAGDVTVNEGADRLFVITPDPDYIVADVLVDESSVGAVTVHVFPDVDEDHTIYATFKLSPIPVTHTFSPASLSYTNTSSNHTMQNYTGNPTAVPDIDVSPSSLIFTKPKTRSARSAADDSASLPDSYTRDRDIPLPADGKYATGLVIPDHVREYWKTRKPSRKYRSRRDIPASKDWSVYDSPVRNQGQCGSCWAFTTVAMMENLANQANLPVDKDFAEQVLVSCLYGGTGCNGGWYWDGLSYIRQNGLPPENCYSYRTNNGNCSNQCSTPDFSVKIENFTPAYGLWGQNNFTVQDLKGALQDGPLCIAMYVADDFYDYNGGIYDYNGGNYEWGHAVFLVGYNDSQQYFKVKNSWGTWWGEGGYFRIAYNDVTDDIKFGSYAVAASGIFIDGENETQELIVSNTGTATLSVTSLSNDKGWLEIAPHESLLAIAPDEQKTLTLSVTDWNSVASPEDTATITIFSNDPDEPSVIVTVKATIPVMGARPMLMVSPPFYGNISVSDGKTQIDVSNDSGETWLDVSNGGDGTMNWTAASDKSWLKITEGSSGTDYGRVLIAYEENTGGTRTGTITVSATGAVNSPQNIEIRQSDIDTDADDDGMTDSFEFQYGFDSSNPDDASGDRDEDGLTNLEEYEIGTNPNLEDTDDDGLSDGYETDNGLNPLVYGESSEAAITDAVTAIRVLAGMNVNPSGTNADADKNGRVEIKDAVYILRMIAK